MYEIADDILLLWTANNIADVIADTEGDIYIVIEQYPKYELSSISDSYYLNGYVYAVDDLSNETIIEVRSSVMPPKYAYFSALDEEVVNPDGYTLGKANFEFTQGYVPVPNNYQRPCPFCSWEAP